MEDFAKLWGELWKYVGFKIAVTAILSIPLVFAALAFTWATPNTRITALETRVAVVEVKQNETSAKLDALIRIECIKNDTNAYRAGIDCPSFFVAKK